MKILGLGFSRTFNLSKQITNYRYAQRLCNGTPVNFEYALSIH